MDKDTINAIEVASDFSGAKLPDNYKNMSWEQFVDNMKFESEEQEEEFAEYYYK